MKLLSTFLVLSGVVTAQVNFDDWHPPVPGDFRSPCPALNSLANHGIIPRDGKNLTVPFLVKALPQALNLSVEVATIVASAGLRTSSDPASGVFTLDDLNKHNAIEHDASLTRRDYNLGGEKQNFCPKIFHEFLGYFKGKEQISIPLAAAARWGRVKTERCRNPKFSYTALNRFNSYSESAIYSELLRDPKTDTVPIEFIKIFFAQERLPYKEGWRPVNLINGFSLAADILQLSLNTPEERADSAGIEDGFVTSHGAMF
ncbi:Cloroperoxidase [Trematosphaeria pertusa]|uniref:Cloroperoxidase n=1 Tax=Trematosphaeria pertusa TaxID=390896 RepID=A0A6A6IX61_9PLEO|nr:Cloroperoxidase [Trematosphaeria pertusa]KAF2254974.1 Cloroperoxidase [Trematosphaeria pertusa]